MNPQDRKERLTVPKPKDVIFEKDSSQPAINFDAYEHIPVKVTGDKAPQPITTFSGADLEKSVAANVVRCRYKKPTPVQKYAIPIGLAGRDLMACAQTGSGKTAAFCFPIISLILNSEDFAATKSGYSRRVYPKALIMGPTRELTNQIYEESRKFTYQTGLRPVVVYGGAPVLDQIRQLERGVDILVATPGRLSSFIERGRVSLSRTKYLVLDEADRMLDMGFEPQIRSIVDATDMPKPGSRQTLMFSATFPKEIQELAADFMSNYLFLAVGRVGSSTNLIIQHFEEVEPGDKQKLLVSLVRAVPGLTLVFVETKVWADRLEHFLVQNKFPATTIHGDLSQEEREYSLEQFRCGAKPILVATDVASRGLDIPHVTHVINYDLPRDIESYVHRIGRTGRAGKKGITTAFFSPGKDSNLAQALVDLLKETNQEVPEFLVEEAKAAGPYSTPPARRGFGGRDVREGHSRGGGEFVISGDYGRGGDTGYGGGDAYD
ncbi:DEAD-domain-containing protein [Coccomyxa subellipsoidea C-169]|uniref:RNA helicase n=1 Tax=Coccomyxa subellipsoidea (strain C-169) TaxID=574566 RepID=I0ZAQ6_COCSC|nr:DEAD-domain-containing protein [Coccomyxa subellipsoidea C-169]EIE27725.1 DEAD-domain-containing protein [Coccomyxa subellipsoidea C-169]|eukprot:XP_005652269.1 DEAD-domain-containing protein [Coccomyxa subellipsoidea C-169]